MPTLPIPESGMPGITACYDVTEDWTPIYDRSALDGCDTAASHKQGDGQIHTPATWSIACMQDRIKPSVCMCFEAEGALAGAYQVCIVVR
jgi:hypothetical protein